MATTTFTCFPQLPTEIQDHIWNLAYNVECPRAFFAVLHLAPLLPQPSNDGSGHQIPRPWWQHFQYELQRIVPPEFIIPCLTDPIDMTPRGVLRKTCRASRIIASKEYPIDIPVDLQEGPKNVHRMVPSGPKSKSLRILDPPPISKATIDAPRSLVLFHPDLAVYGVSARPFPPAELVPEGLKDYTESSASLRYLGVLWTRDFGDRDFSNLSSRGFFNLFISFPQLRVLYIVLHPKEIPEAMDISLKISNSSYLEKLDGSDETQREQAFNTFRWRDMDFFGVPSNLVAETGRHKKLLETIDSLNDVASSWYEKIGMSKNQLKIKVMTWRVLSKDGSGNGVQEAMERKMWDSDDSEE